MTDQRSDSHLDAGPGPAGSASDPCAATGGAARRGPLPNPPAMTWTVRLAEAGDAERVQHHQAAVLITVTRWLTDQADHDTPDAGATSGEAAPASPAPAPDQISSEAGRTDPTPRAGDRPEQAA